MFRIPKRVLKRKKSISTYVNTIELLITSILHITNNIENLTGVLKNIWIKKHKITIPNSNVEGDI